MLHETIATMVINEHKHPPSQCTLPFGMSDSNEDHVVVIDKSVPFLDNSSFANCRTLQSIIIPNSVTYIGEEAFKDCTALETLTLPSSITRIQRRTFQGCSSLSFIHVPSTVTEIGPSAFWRCTSLKSVIIPPSVAIVDIGTFSYCSSLQSVELPPSLIEIKSGAFFKCCSLKHIILPDSITEIGVRAFQGCSSLRSIALPTSMTNINANILRECSSLIAVFIPSTIQSIEEIAFEGCTSLQLVAIPKSLSGTGHHIFRRCAMLVPREVHGLYHYTNTFEWLSRRFERLPLHRACYYYSWDENENDLDHLSKLMEKNWKSLYDIDAMGMTALHILCCNLNVTEEVILLMKRQMIKSVISNTDDKFSDEKIGSIKSPLEMFLECRYLDIPSCEETDEQHSTLLMKVLLQGIGANDLGCLFALEEDRLMRELVVADEDINLLPFMYAASNHQCGLETAYLLASRRIDLIINL